MFKFTVVDHAGNVYLSTKDVTTINDQFQARCDAVGVERAGSLRAKEIHVPASNLLMIAQGWQGGTIHQVAKVTGLSINEIMELHTVQREKSKLDGLSDYDLGYHHSHIKTDMSIIRDKMQYWRGVIESVRQYQKTKILAMVYSNYNIKGR